MDKKLDNPSLEEMLNSLRELSMDLLRLQERVDSLRLGLTDFMLSAASAEAFPKPEPQPEPAAAVHEPEQELEIVVTEMEPEMGSETIEPEAVEPEVVETEVVGPEPESEVLEPETLEPEPDAEMLEPDAVETEAVSETPEPLAEILEPEQEPEPEPESEPEPGPEEPLTLGDRYKRERAEKPLCETIEIHHSADMSQSMSLNDRFLYQRELFGGDAARFYEVMAAIDTFCTYEEAADYVRSAEDWDEESSAAQDFLDMLQRHFS